MRLRLLVPTLAWRKFISARLTDRWRAVSVGFVQLNAMACSEETTWFAFSS
jgi:hypothetical protein